MKFLITMMISLLVLPQLAQAQRRNVKRAYKKIAHARPKIGQNLRKGAITFLSKNGVEACFSDKKFDNAHFLGMGACNHSHLSLATRNVSNNDLKQAKNQIRKKMGRVYLVKLEASIANADAQSGPKNRSTWVGRAWRNLKGLFSFNVGNFVVTWYPAPPPW